jgi:peptidoglycan/LPS O-acetylase OafA/YrhL
LLRLEQQETGRVSLRDFYLRRVLRILPPFYTVLLLAVVLAWAGILYPDLRTVPVLAQAGHFANYWSIYRGTDGMPGGTGVYWSLAVEEHFYLLFPALFILLQRKLPGRWRTHAHIFFGLCALVLAWRCVLVWSGASTDRTYLASDTRIDSILFGCALAVGANPMLDPLRGSPALWRWVLMPLGFLLVMFTFVYRAEWFRETLRYTLQGMGLYPIFVVAMREPKFGPFRFLNLRPVKHVGVLSYSLYLLHFVIIYALIRQAPGLTELPRGVVAFVLSLVLAQIINRFIEKPCARLRRRLAHASWLGKNPAPTAAPAPAAAPVSR